ncbi:MAG: crosslink repair DNA glycosylase YcaQ family protein [Thermoplasmata archaeon]
MQVDPLNVVGHSHDLALWGRIVAYRADHLEDALYAKRTLFETGGNVQIRPISELPYLRVAMRRKVEEPRWRRFARAKADVIGSVLRAIDRRGPLGPADFTGSGEKRIRNYRAGKESGLALYYLWLRGDLMVAFRRGGEKVFDRSERLLHRPVPEIPVPDAEEHLILETLRHLGVATRSEWLRHAWPHIGRMSLRREWAERIRVWEKEGIFQEIEVDGWTEPQCILAESVSDLEALRSSKVPSAWRPRSTTTDREVVFLAPLEVVAARGRSSRLFDFEYIWEVYKPASKRQWGYYTLPVLYGTRLCAKIEMRFDGPSGRLSVLGFWPEASSIRSDSPFGAALGRGLGRLASFHGATQIDVTGFHSPGIEARATRAAAETFVAVSVPR